METYKELEPIVKDYFTRKYQDRFGAIANARVINYVEMVATHIVDQDKKKSMLRDINIDILDGGDEKELNKQIENNDGLYSPQFISQAEFDEIISSGQERGQVG